MYKIPHTGKRVMMKADFDATYNGAKTEWGKKRAMCYLIDFEQIAGKKGKHHLPPAVMHPIAAWRYERAWLRNLKPECETLCCISFDVKNDDLRLINGRLKKAELAYLNAVRMVEYLEARGDPDDIDFLPKARAKVEEAAETLKYRVEYPEIAHTNIRAILKADYDATLAAAKDESERTRTAAFFEEFLREGFRPSDSLIASRYEKIFRENLLADVEVTRDNTISNQGGPLYHIFQVNYMNAERKLEAALIREQDPSVIKPLEEAYRGLGVLFQLRATTIM